MIAIKILGCMLLVFFIHSILPTYYNKWLNNNVMKKTNNDNEIMLTFDDGPDERYIYSLMDVLDQFDVKATFFMVAENAKKNKKVVEDVIKRGHQVGLHSWQHRNAMFYSYFYTKKDFENSVVIMKEFGIKNFLYRPPWGHVNIFTNFFARKYKMKYVYWDVMAEDWQKKATPISISDKLLIRTTKNSIICLHDAGENSGGAKDAPLDMIEGLKIAIPKLKEKGYKFIL